MISTVENVSPMGRARFTVVLTKGTAAAVVTIKKRLHNIILIFNKIYVSRLQCKYCQMTTLARFYMTQFDVPVEEMRKGVLFFYCKM